MDLSQLGDFDWIVSAEKLEYFRKNSCPTIFFI